MKRLVAVGSGKGGVGKTWFAISLSQALARLGHRILLVDGDIGLANVDVQIGLSKETIFGTAARRKKSVRSAISRLQALDLDVLPGRSQADAADRPWAERMIKELRAVQPDYDLIVVDLPSGIDVDMRRLMMAADDPIIVTTEEPTALTDAYALIKTIRRQQPGFLPDIVVNLVESHQAGHRTFEGFSRVCRRFLTMMPHSLGAVRRDRRVAEAISRQTPLYECYPQSEAAEDVRSLALALVKKASSR